MRTFPSIVKTAGSALALAGALALLPASSQAAEAEAKSAVEQGKAVSFDRKKGNCLACHQIEGGSLPGNIGPPLIAMKARFPDKAKLRAATMSVFGMLNWYYMWNSGAGTKAREDYADLVSTLALNGVRGL